MEDRKCFIDPLDECEAFGSCNGSRDVFTDLVWGLAMIIVYLLEHMLHAPKTKQLQQTCFKTYIYLLILGEMRGTLRAQIRRTYRS